MYEELLHEACARSGTPGAVMAIATSEGVTTAPAGIASTSSREPMRPDHQFPPMSIAKSMTAILVVELCRDGRLSLGTPVADVLRVPAPWARAVTIDHLLACTGGLEAFHFPDTGDGDDAVSSIVATLYGLASVCEPGSRFSYSNTAFAIAAAVVEAVTGRTFDDVLHDVVFAPLALHDTGSWYRQVPDRPITQHIVSPDRSAIESGWWKLRSGGGAGSGTLFSTARDLATYGRAHILRWPELREPQAAFPGPHAESWARGWAIYGWGSGVFGWDGFAPGAKTFLRVFPEHDAAVALLTNGSNGREVYRRVLPTVLDEQFGMQMAPETWSPSPSDTTSSDTAVIGAFRNGAAGVSVKRLAAGLSLRDFMGRTLALTPVDATRFVTAHDFDYPTVEIDGDLLLYFCSAWRRVVS